MSSQGKSTPYGASLQHPLAPVPTAVRKHSGKSNKGKKDLIQTHGPNYRPS